MAVKFHGTNVVTQVVNNEHGGSSWDLVLKVLSITLVSLFAFSSGIWFGKKLSDSDYQRQALEGEFDREVQKSSDSLATYKAAEDDDVLTDEEVAAATDKAMEASRKAASADPAEAKADQVAAHSATTSTQQASATAVAAGGTVSAPATHAAVPVTPATISTKAAAKSPADGTATRAVASTSPSASKPDLSAAHQAATRVANNAAPTNPAAEQAKTESRVPSSLPKTVGASADVEFTVQVASYPTAEAAKEHVEAMVKKGFPAFPVEAKINGKTWYRVSVGSFKSFNEASKFRAQLLKQADLPSAIVQKIAR
jgi:cell division protein FtsN